MSSKPPTIPNDPNDPLNLAWAVAPALDRIRRRPESAEYARADAAAFDHAFLSSAQARIAAGQ